MPHYIIQQKETYLTLYRVEAENMMSAFHEVKTGGGKVFHKEYLHANTDEGMAGTEYTKEELEAISQGSV